MDAAPAPLPPNLWDALPAETQTLILGLQAEVAALQKRIHELPVEAGVSHPPEADSNSSRPPSSDPSHVMRKRPAPPTGRKRGGQSGYPGYFRSLQGGRILRLAGSMVGPSVHVCAARGSGTHQQRRRTGPASGGTLAQG